MAKEKILIIGAGLSGLYTALLLQDRYEVIVIEARDRVGGRVQSMGGHDMGPSWVWGHQKHILALIDTLGLRLFEQYTKGLALYDAPDGVQKFQAPQTSVSYRVEGGIITMIDAVNNRLHSPVKLNEKVISLSDRPDGVEVCTDKESYFVSKVVSTIPPRLAVDSIAYTPALPTRLHSQLKNIPTWMGYATKCVIEFPDAFWKEVGLSGFTFSHIGPLSEIHDACTEEKNALFGFVHSHAPYGDLKENIHKQLLRLYREQAYSAAHIYMVDWTKEFYTSTLLDAQPIREHPNYGFENTHFDAKLLFSGTESAMCEGGYLEGAVYSALRIQNILGEENEKV